jgi:hypothetical protein
MGTPHLSRSYYAIIIGTIAAAGAMRSFLLYWIVPYCTAHIAYQYIRLICEHSAVHSNDPAYTMTRTTLARCGNDGSSFRAIFTTTSNTTGIRACLSIICPRCTID